jgi:hypothetical protein
MPTFGGLLKKKKTKDEKEEKSKESQKAQALSPVPSKTDGQSQASTAVASTAAPTQTASNGEPKKSEMSPAPAGGDPKASSRQTKGKYTLTDFTISRTLGTGSFGRVHLVQSKHNQRYYAVKVLKKQQVVKMKQIEHTNDERKMLQRVKHPFCITLWGTFQDSKNLYMVMDFIEGGELFSLLRKSQVSSVPSSHCIADSES